MKAFTIVWKACRYAALLGSVLGFCLAGPVLADEDSSEGKKLAEPIQEFFLADTVYPQEKGETQVTFASAFFRSQRERDLVFSLKAEYGLSDRFQVEAELPARFLQPRSGPSFAGLADGSFGLLYNLTNRPQFAASIGLEVGLPTGDKDRELGEGVVEWEPVLLLGRSFGKTQLHLGVGCGLSRHGTEWSYNVAAVFPQGRFSPTLELNGRASDEGGTLFATPGLYYRLAEGAELGFGIPIGTTRHSAEYGVIGKLTFEF
jgi:hypothetical protein